VKLLGVLFLLLLIAAAAIGFLVYAPLTPNGEVFIDLPTGTGSSEMAQKLQDGHVIRNRYAFLLLRAWKGGSLKAGEYRFAEPASAAAVYARIARGDVYTRAVTIPEGFNLYDIAAAVEAAGLGSRTAFLQAAQTNADLVSAFAPAAKSLEGYLYPDTYRFSRHTTLRTMQETMVHRFRKQAASMGLLSTPDIARTVILASLVEKEVHFDNERTEAAGVFTNRLNRNMPLQTDPTVIYAALQAGRWTGVIHRSDLDFDSPYNTYRHAGLPPGPICSPGAAALRAAMNPATTENLYFVADTTGHTQFSAGLKEHADQVESYRKGVHR
jgi:UPF0755 protein